MYAKRTLLVLTLATALLGLAAETSTWTGSLADAKCKAATPDAACPVSATTNAFGLATSDGNFAPFDAAGNAEAAKQVIAKKKTGNPPAAVTGKLEKGVIQVQEIALR